jgi:hypothetical protein
MRLWITSSIAVVLMVGITGCPRFSTKLSYSLAMGDIRRINIDAPASEQNVKVEVSSPTATVSIYIVLEENAQQVEDSLALQKAPDRSLILASAEVREKGTVEAKVPKKKAYCVFVVGTKPSEVDVTISGS